MNLEIAIKIIFIIYACVYSYEAKNTNIETKWKLKILIVMLQYSIFKLIIEYLIVNNIIVSI